MRISGKQKFPFKSKFVEQCLVKKSRTVQQQFRGFYTVYTSSIRERAFESRGEREKEEVFSSSFFFILFSLLLFISSRSKDCSRRGNVKKVVTENEGTRNGIIIKALENERGGSEKIVKTKRKKKENRKKDTEKRFTHGL